MSRHKPKIIGIRPGEKLHEQMIGVEDAPYTFEYENYYKILPMINGWSTEYRIKDGKKVDKNFSTSDNKIIDERSELRDWMKNYL